MSVFFDKLGDNDVLPQDVEEGPKDLFCYCNRCCYKRLNTERVRNNFFYGLFLQLLWVYNLFLYFTAQRLDSQYKFSESIEWHYKDEIKLIISLEDDSIVSSMIREHEKTDRQFDQFCGWSALGMVLEGVIIVLLVMLYMS